MSLTRLYFFYTLNFLFYKLKLDEFFKNEEKTHMFVLVDKEACRNLWKCCVDHHRFFRLKAVYEEPSKISTSLATAKRSR